MPTAFKSWQKFDAELSPHRRDRGLQDRQPLEDIQGERDRVFEEEVEKDRYGKFCRIDLFTISV